MKRFCIILSLMIACLFCAAPLNCSALDYDPRLICLEYRNAPEGTAYIDILARISESDEAYTVFNTAPMRLTDKPIADGSTEFVYETLDIDSSSGIAKYNEDGFVSLTIHSKEVRELMIMKSCGYTNDELMLDCNADDLYQKYKKFRIAYVGEKGEVLKVTDKAGRDYSFRAPYSFIADDSTATYISFGMSPLCSLLILAGVIVLVFLIFILPPVLIINKLAERKRIRQLAEQARSKSDTVKED